MSEKELRELDAWIAEHVMEWVRVAKIGMLDHAGRFHYRPEIGEVFIHKQGNEVCYFHPTTDPAAAMQVLKACLKSSRPHGGIIVYDSQISQVPCFTVEAQAIGNLRMQAETLPLAIALFAKKLFSK